jgi:hypothetical protein
MVFNGRDIGLLLLHLLSHPAHLCITNRSREKHQGTHRQASIPSSSSQELKLTQFRNHGSQAVSPSTQATPRLPNHSRTNTDMSNYYFEPLPTRLAGRAPRPSHHPAHGYFPGCSLGDRPDAGGLQPTARHAALAIPSPPESEYGSNGPAGGRSSANACHGLTLPGLQFEMEVGGAWIV